MTAVVKLKIDAWRTYGARYNAARRLRRRALVSTVSLAFFSAATVGLSLIQVIFPEPSYAALNRYLTALSGCIGVFILVTSLIEWGAKNNERADSLHRNAEALNGFSRRLWIRLDHSDAVPLEDALSAQAEYDAIKATCADNHDPVDDRFFVVQHRFSKEFRIKESVPAYNWLQAQKIKFQYYFSSVWYFGVCWILLAYFVVKAPWH